MARVTVEDCILKVPNRFDLVMLAAQRAREISSGSTLTIDRDDDKNPVVALREIAEETIDLGLLGDTLVHGLQKQHETEEPEETGGFGASGSELLNDLLQDQAAAVQPEDATVEEEPEEDAPVPENDVSELAPGEE